MLVIRPIALPDLAGLESLAALTGYGLTTLPRDPALLRRRIRASVRGFEKLIDDDRPRGEVYLLALEDLATGRVVGTSGVVAKVGGFEPFYAYRIETAVHESKMLNVRKEIQVLHLVEEHDGPCEVGSLFLAPEYRRGGAGRLLSLSRFLLMAQFPEYFDPIVIAELRGVVDDQGHSPLWESLGRHFFDIDYPTADYLSMVNKRFIADLMPKHPIYIPLLPAEAQAVIGQVHDQTLPAMRMLLAEGFSRCGLVDIFEGGPVVRCALSDVRTVRESAVAPVAQVTEQPPESEPFIVSNGRQDFRACLAPLEVLGGGGGGAGGAGAGVRIGIQHAMALRLRVGDPIRYVAARPAARARERAADDSQHIALH